MHPILPGAAIGVLGSGQPGRMFANSKLAARPGRKMGHLTALADNTEIALETALAARSALTSK